MYGSEQFRFHIQAAWASQLIWDPFELQNWSFNSLAGRQEESEESIGSIALSKYGRWDSGHRVAFVISLPRCTAYKSLVGYGQHFFCSSVSSLEKAAKCLLIRILTSVESLDAMLPGKLCGTKLFRRIFLKTWNMGKWNVECPAWASNVHHRASNTKRIATSIWHRTRSLEGLI